MGSSLVEERDMANPNEDTVELTPPAVFAETFFAPVEPALALQFGAATHQGHVRSNNEDQFAVVKRRRTSEVLLSSLNRDDLVETDDSTYGLVVADGIGGSRYGEVASRIAVQAMLELSSQATSWVMKLNNMDAQQIRDRAEAYIRRIQQTMRDAAKDDPELDGMGTTWTSAHLIPPHAVIVHLGDSRAYLCRGDRLLQVTHDETMAQVWIDAGMEWSMVTKFRHLLLNRLGSDADGVVTQIHQIPFAPGDQLLLCSDGLYDMVPDDVIREELRRHDGAQSACDALIRLALEAGGRDNVTVVLAKAAKQ